MEDGAIIHVDYDLFSGETGDLIETTREEVAKEHEMHQEGRSYAPMVCVEVSSLIQDSSCFTGCESRKEVEINCPRRWIWRIYNEVIGIDKLKRSVQDPQSSHRYQ